VGLRKNGRLMSVDWEAEGLLEGTEGEAREGRRKLLDDLHESGLGLDELREAVQEGRLVLLPLEQVLAGDGPRLSREEVADRAEVELDFLRRSWRALGMTEPEEGEKAFTERDVDMARIVKQLTDIGIPEDEMLQVSRVIGMTMSQLAAANRGLGLRVFTQEGDSEYDVGKRFAAIAEGLGPLLASILEYALQLHMREQIRHDAFASSEISAEVERGTEISVAFADLVGFTKLGERLDPAEIGDLTAELSDMAGEVSGGPVRLVKLIGDAVMLTSNDPACLLDAALDLVSAAEGRGEGFPLLRAGVAYGRAVARGGDYYGRPVNLASRITAVARPGSVLCDENLHEEVEEERFRWSFAGARRLKGIDDEVKLFRARPAEPPAGDEEADS
jgi:adenylate cyclase